MPLSLIPAPWRCTELDQIIPVRKVEERLNPELSAQEYRLMLTERECSLEGGSDAAILLGRATLEQIRLQCPDAFPVAFIEDKPSVEWRSFHIDSARHFWSMDELKKMIRTAWLFKFNRFHWHFSDDQGWRIESKRFPKLHELGSVRKGDHFGQDYSEAEEGAYYTRDEVKELVAYCAEFGIEVVPEIDFPGHTSAILHAYPEFSCDGEPVEVKTSQGIFYDVICAGNDDAVRFCCDLLDDMLELFPGEYFHLGGDEAPKTHWKNCPRCQARMKELGLSDLRELQGDFQNRLVAHLKERGRKAAVWNEACYGGNLDPDALIQLWTKDRSGRLPAQLETGNPVLYSPFRHAYCDYPFGLQTLRDIYNLETKPKEATLRDGSCPVIGTECLIWTEFIRTPERLEEYAWPRFAASAEAAWRGDKKPGYRDFTKRLRAFFPHFAELGIHAMPENGWTRFSKSTLRDTFSFAKNFRGKFRQNNAKAHRDM